jgi:hypothetical protein
MTVELDVFSGRPNPQWALSVAEAARVWQLLEGLPETEPDKPEPALGFRGFIVRDNGRRISVRGGLVYIEDLLAANALDDVRGLEEYLRELAVGRGYGPFIEAR